MPIQPVGNIPPYYDDFDKTKNYLRIMYNPSRAVQARELTQSQTVLQNQIAEFADRIFKDSVAVSGARISVGYQQPYMVAAISTNENVLTSLVGMTIVGQTSNQKAVVERVDVASRSIYFTYRGASFVDGESFVTEEAPYYTFDTDLGTLGFATVASCTEGEVYHQGFMVYVPSQSIIVSHETTGQFHIGFKIDRKFVTVNDDSTLADPANGSYNYNAPGADRYTINMTLFSYEESQASQQDLENFIAGIVIKDGVLIQEQTEDKYSEIMDMLAKRTYDESGNYTVEPWKVVVTEHPTDETKVRLEVQPGNGYIQGYNVKTVISEILDVDKSRDTGTTQGLSLFLNDGVFVKVLTNPSTSAPSTSLMLNPVVHEEVEIMTGTNGTGTKLGEARIHSMTKVGLEIYVQLSNTDAVRNLIPSAKSIRSKTTPANYINLKLTTDGLAEVDGQSNSWILDTTYDQIKTIAANSVEYDFVKKYSGQTAASDVITITETDNNVNFYGLDGVLHIYNVTDNAVVNPNSVSVVPSNATNPPSVAITVPGSGSDTFDIYLKVKRKNANTRTKTLVTVSRNITVQPGVNTFTLPDEDIFDVTAINQTANLKAGMSATDALMVAELNRRLDNGQRDYYYDVGVLRGFNESVMNAYKASTDSATTYTITYRYFTHSGVGFFSTGSYVNSANLLVEPNIYKKIPSYRTSYGVNFDLRDSVDFRSKLSELSTGLVETPVARSFVESDVEYYLPRIDSVWIDKEGNFGTTKGVPSLRAEAPLQKDGVMVLYNLYLKPYVNDKSGVVPKYINNQRYTMADIGKLDARLSSLEEVTSLSLLEASANTLKIVDETGLDKFKSGIFAEPFKDLTERSDYTNEEFTATLDAVEQSCRCQFSADNVSLEVNGASSTNIFGSKMLTLPFTETVYARNPYATKSVNVQQYLFHVWNGIASITPSVDTWVTDLGSNIVSEIFVDTPPPPPSVRSWSRWLPRFQETFTETTTYQAGTATVDDVRYYEKQDEFMRQRRIDFTLTGMRPGMTIAAKIDNKPITTLSATTVGTDGKLVGYFTVPANVPVGSKVVTFVDAEATSNASCNYYATGKTVWRDIYRTNIRSWTPITTKSSQRIDYGDPVAQSFYVDNPGGMFLSSIDLFFASKDNSLPIECVIVEMDGGFPSTRVVANGRKVLDASQVVVGLNTPTKFAFSTPVYLEDKTEYAFILITNSRSYKIYVSELSKADLNTGIGIAEQPFLGSFFMSQNARTWDALQMLDAKFVMRKAQFNVGTGEAVFRNASVTETLEVAFQTLNVNVFTPAGTTVKTYYRWRGQSNWIEFTNPSDVFNNTMRYLSTDDNALPSRSFEMKVAISTTNANVSPIIDTEQVYGIFVRNNVVATGDTEFPWDAGTYITKAITLANPSDDLRVILDVIRPGASDIDVYFRTEDYTPSYVTMSKTGLFGTNESDAEKLIGKEVAIYYRAKTGNTLTFKGKCVVAGYDGTEDPNDRKVFLKSIQDVSLFRDTVDGTTPSYTGLADVESIFMIDSANGTTIPTLKPFAQNTLFNAGEYVYYGGQVWKARVTQSSSPSQSIPSVLGTDWILVPSIRSISAVKQYSTIKWRKMARVEQNYVSGTSFDTQFVESRYVPEKTLDSEFKTFQVKIDMKARNKVDVPRLKNLRVVAAY